MAKLSNSDDRLTTPSQFCSSLKNDADLPDNIMIYRKTYASPCSPRCSYCLGVGIAANELLSNVTTPYVTLHRARQ